MSRISTVIFDLDGTLVRYRGVEFESSWGALGMAAGVDREWDRLLDRYLHEIDAYSEWMAANAKCLIGISVNRVRKKILPPPYSEGVEQAIESLKRHYVLGILSSGLDIVATYVQEHLGLDFCVANRLIVENGKFTGQAETIVDLWSKPAAIKRIADNNQLALSEICYIGDHRNDIDVMKLVGASIAFNPKDPELKNVADQVTYDFGRIPNLVEQLQHSR